MTSAPSKPKPGVPWGKVVMVAVIGMVAGGLYWQFGDRLSLDSLASHEQTLRGYQEEYPALIYVVAFAIYVTVTGLSLPGASALTLVYGWYFGFWRALPLISFASTAGATVAFLMSRYFFRDAIQNRFGDRLKGFNKALEREGAFYLFTLRLIPAVPFFVINAVMGLTKIRVVTYWWVSQIGMFAGTCVYVYAGSTIPSLAHLADPSQVNATDILDWDEFTSQLKSSGGKGAAGAIWQRLSDESKQAITTSAPLDNDAQRKLITELNDLIRSPDFAIKPAWQDALRPKTETDKSVPQSTIKIEKERRAAAKRLTLLNREILVAAFPKTISPPQPIISTRLFVAFAILGLFPLAVKKTMQRLRPTDDKAGS